MEADIHWPEVLFWGHYITTLEEAAVICPINLTKHTQEKVLRTLCDKQAVLRTILRTIL